MSPLLLELWREQHPQGHEQVALDFTDHQRRAEAKFSSTIRKKKIETVVSESTNFHISCIQTLDVGEQWMAELDKGEFAKQM